MIRTAIYIICIVAVTLLIYNQTLISKIKYLEVEQEELYSQYLDLQEEYELVFDEVIRLEQENQILGSAAAVNTVKYND